MNTDERRLARQWGHKGWVVMDCDGAVMDCDGGVDHGRDEVVMGS